MFKVEFVEIIERTQITYPKGAKLAVVEQLNTSYGNYRIIGSGAVMNSKKEFMIFEVKHCKGKGLQED